MLDEADFERFLGAVEPLMMPGRGVAWFLAGRTESTAPKLKKSCTKYKLHSVLFYFVL